MLMGTVGVPAMLGGTVGLGDEATLAMMTPMAPFAWAFCTLVVKLQVPRSMKAIGPLTWAALTKGDWQPSVTVPPVPVVEPSFTRITSAVTLKAVRPKLADSTV